MGRLIDADKFLERVKKDREHEIYLHSWAADMVLKRLDSWYAPTVEAILKADYEARLSVDMIAMLEELNLEIDEMFARRIDYTVDKIQDLIQEKIDALKGDEG